MNTMRRTASVPALLGLVIYCGCGGSSTVAPQNEQTVAVIAYTLQPGTNGLHEIHLINLDGTGGRRLIEASIGLNHHDWSPDATQLRIGTAGVRPVAPPARWPGPSTGADRSRAD